MELTLAFIVIMIMTAFICEYVDSTLGMGYGTALTPILLLLGFSPLHIVPTILLSELITGISAGFLHHKHGNVEFKLKTNNLVLILRKVSSLGVRESFRRGVSKHLKIGLLLAICSVAGTIAAVFIAVNIPEFWLNLYIGCLVLSMGIIIICFNRNFPFSWKKITFLGLVASFNKGMSGGGYGPLVTSGQILSGVEGKSAVGITSLAEGLTCAVGVITYLFMAKDPIDWKLAPYVITGAVLSVPFSVISVKKITEKRLKITVALLTIILGTVTIVKTLC